MGNVCVCTGSCHGSVTEEDFNSGKNVCATDGCEQKGRPLVKRVQCESCAGKGETGFCENCSE
jgi:hypothetical protein